MRWYIIICLFPEAADWIEIALTVTALTFHFGAPQGLVPGVLGRQRRRSRLIILIETLGKQLQLPWPEVVQTSLQDGVAILVAAHLKSSQNNTLIINKLIVSNNSCKNN